MRKQTDIVPALKQGIGLLLATLIVSASSTTLLFSPMSAIALAPPPGGGGGVTLNAQQQAFVNAFQKNGYWMNQELAQMLGSGSSTVTQVCTFVGPINQWLAQNNAQVQVKFKNPFNVQIAISQTLLPLQSELPEAAVYATEHLSQPGPVQQIPPTQPAYLVGDFVDM